jgi:hypothetical protein
MKIYSKIISFESIPSIPNRNYVMTRLGFKKNLTKIDFNHQRKLEQGFKDGMIYCRSKGTAGRFIITSHHKESIIIETGLCFQSKSLVRLLKSCNELVLIAATVGKEVIERINYEIEQGDAAYGAVLDAVASETADACLDWIINFLNKIIYREGKRITKHRYSPGYGDLDLSYQKAIFDLLDLEKLGLNLTEKLMLTPEKSVIAIAGIERIETDGQD